MTIEPHKKPRAWEILKYPGLVSFSILAGVGCATLIMWALDRAAPVIYHEATAVRNTATAGEQLEILLDVTRNRICPVLRSTRYVRDSNGVEHTVNNFTVSTTLRPGRERYDRIITVPDTVALGAAEYYIKIVYACNPIHNLGFPIIVESPHVKFTVVPPQLGFPLKPLSPSNEY